MNDMLGTRGPDAPGNADRGAGFQHAGPLAEPLLSVRDVTVRFGGIVALNRLSFDIPQGGVHGLIGPNGAGKTTLFNILSRLYDCESGDIVFGNKQITRIAAHSVAGFGIGRTFQNLAMFESLTVQENVAIGAHSHTSAGFLASALKLPHVTREEVALTVRLKELLALLDLEAVANRKVAELPFGQRKRVEFARALASRPKLLLLDEPAAGLNHDEIDSLARLIVKAQRELGITVLLVEHHMGLVMSISERVVVMNFGAKIAEGTPAEVQANPAVIAAYLGGSSAVPAALQH